MLSDPMLSFYSASTSNLFMCPLAGSLRCFSYFSVPCFNSRARSENTSGINKDINITTVNEVYRVYSMCDT